MYYGECGNGELQDVKRVNIHRYGGLPVVTLHDWPAFSEMAYAARNQSGPQPELDI